MVSFLILSNQFTFPSTWDLCSTSCGDQGDGGFGPWNQDTLWSPPIRDAGPGLSLVRSTWIPAGAGLLSSELFFLFFL